MAVSEGLLLLLLLSPRLAAEVVREGAEVTLHCPGDRLPQSQCSETSWVFSHGPIEELFTQEQSGSGVSPAPSSRLSLTEDCGLNIKHALPEDGGEYYCSLDYTDYTSGMSLSVVKLKETGEPTPQVTPSGGASSSGLMVRYVVVCVLLTALLLSVTIIAVHKSGRRVQNTEIEEAALHLSVGPSLTRAAESLRCFPPVVSKLYISASLSSPPSPSSPSSPSSDFALSRLGVPTVESSINNRGIDVIQSYGSQSFRVDCRQPLSSSVFITSSEMGCFGQLSKGSQLTPDVEFDRNVILQQFGVNEQSHRLEGLRRGPGPGRVASPASGMVFSSRV
uniref:Ig-like domain-containing protein n=1 Tax=Knipowitschia caucasica TaxID=637954 RepID=A0AAV2MH91_KNICA